MGSNRSRAVWTGTAVAITWASLAHAQVRVMSWNLAELRGEPDAIAFVIDAVATDDRAGFAAPVAMMLLQEVDFVTYDAVSGMLDSEWSSATYTNSNEDPYGGAQACFYHAATLTEVPSGHADLYTGAGRRADRWQFTLNGYTDPPVNLYVYSAHLKAGTGSSNQEERRVGAVRITDDIAKLPAGSRYVVVGDMNYYSNNEPGYQAFLAAGLEDPLGTGSWGGASNAIKHSQSPRKIQAGGLASGGLDDRFDFQLSSPLMLGTGGLSIISGTYRSVGNDGNHHDIAINDGNNTYWADDPSASNALADALWAASDHVPVVADYRIPAVLDAAFDACDLGTVIVDYELNCSVNIANGASPGVPIGGASLDWSLSGTGVLAGNTGSGSLAPGESEAIALSVDTSAAGVFDDALQLAASDELTQHGSASMALSGQILRHANPSFVSDADNDFYVYFLEVEPDTGDVAIGVQFWNYLWDNDQSRMDIDMVTTPEPPVAYLGAGWNNVGPFPVSMPFSVDTTGLTPGTIVRPVTITVSDEDLPGEASSFLHLTFNITVLDPEPACIGDVTGDGITDVTDLLAFLDGFGGSDPALDLVPDGIIDINDMLVLLGDFGCGV